MRLLPVVLLLTACAAQPARPVYYCDGVETCPPEAFTHPGYTPAGAGLPEYRPTEEEPEVPRSPHKRVLPPTKESGLWSAEEPKAVLPATPTILGVALPFPPQATDAEAQRPTRTCAVVADGWANGERYAFSVSRMSSAQKRCLAARLYSACAAEQWQQTKGTSTTLAKRAEMHRRHSSALVQAWCSEALTAPMQTIESDFARMIGGSRWNTQ